MTRIVPGPTTATGGASAPPDEADPPVAGTAPRARRTWLAPRGRFARVDPLVVAAAVLALLGAVGFLALNAASNGGRLVPPLDDVYIHLQYARQLGAGDLLRYQPDTPPTTGASSLLYVALLALASLVVGPSLLLYAAIAFGVGALVATVVGVALLGRTLASRRVGVAAAVLTALSGPLLWGATSGMEVSLVALLVVATLLAFAREQASARFVVTPMAATLLAVARPEGLVLVVAVLAGVTVVLVEAHRRGRLPRRRILRTAAWCAVPPVVAALQLLLYRVLTGSAENTGVQAKSWFSVLHSPLELADRMDTSVRTAIDLFGGIADDRVVGPGVAVLAALGIAGLALGHPRRRVVAGVVVLGLAGVVVAVSTLTTAFWHEGRYLQPFLPVVLLLAVLGVRAVARAVGDPRSGRVLGAGLLALLLTVGVVVAPGWGLREAQQAAGIRESAVSVAAWVRGNTPPGSRIGVNDVGAVAYLSDRPVVDLVGLTTPGIARASTQGPGALYSALTRLPVDQRPDYFSTWDPDDGGTLRDGLLVDPDALVSFQIKSPVRDGGPFGGVCQTAGGCSVTSVWRADWSHVGSGLAPDDPVPGRIVDHVDVGDLDDEAAHGYRVDAAITGVDTGTLVRHRVRPDGSEIVDAGRHVVGGETFTLHGLTPGVPVTLTARGDAKEPVAGRNTQAGVVAVDVEGRRAGEWTFATADGPWAQSSVVVPGAAVTGPTLTVGLGPRSPYLAPFPDYRSFGYWASQ